MSFSQVNVYSKIYNFKRYYTYIYVNGIRKQKVDSTYNLRVPFTICGFHLQFADSTYSCGFRNGRIQLHTGQNQICRGIRNIATGISPTLG